MRLMKSEDFEPWVGRAVRVNTVPEPVELVLTRIERKRHRITDHRAPFSLFFEAHESVYLLNETYEFDCGRGGPHSLYITQLQPPPGRRLYQAVFN